MSKYIHVICGKVLVGCVGFVVNPKEVQSHFLMTREVNSNAFISDLFHKYLVSPDRAAAQNRLREQETWSHPRPWPVDTTAAREASLPSVYEKASPTLTVNSTLRGTTGRKESLVTCQSSSLAQPLRAQALESKCLGWILASPSSSCVLLGKILISLGVCKAEVTSIPTSWGCCGD